MKKAIAIVIWVWGMGAIAYLGVNGSFGWEFWLTVPVLGYCVGGCCASIFYSASPQKIAAETEVDI